MFVFSLIHVALFIDVHLKSANTMGSTNNIQLNNIHVHCRKTSLQLQNSQLDKFR